MRAFVLLLLSAFSISAAVNGTTPTALNLLSTFHCISVRAPFTGDENRNNSAVVQFQMASGGTWFNAYTPWIDRRIEIVHTLATVSNTMSNEARVSIVGLSANTSYNVRVEWTDGDGITGAAAITNTISTLSYAVPTNGPIYYVDSTAVSEGSGSAASPWKTITNAHRKAIAGDTIIVTNDVEYLFPAAWTNGGSASSWIWLKAASGSKPVISGGGGTATINGYIGAGYLCIDGFVFASTTNSNLEISNNVSSVRIQNCAFTNICLNHAANSAVGITTKNNSTNLFFLTNTFYTARNSSLNADTNIYGIAIGKTNVTFIAAFNKFTNVWDGIGTGNNTGDGVYENGDWHDNYFYNTADDAGGEVEGDFCNFRYWNNTVNSTNFGSVIAISGVWIGPAYVFRSVFQGTNMGSYAGGGTGIKHDATRCPGKVYLFHNVIDTRGNTVSGSASGLAGGTNTTIRNCLWINRGNAYESAGHSVGFDSDYNGFTNTQTLVYHWAGTLTDYETLALFTAGTGQDAHSFYGVPQFNAGSYTLNTNSPAKDAGASLNNFNGEGSAWPNGGSAPDIGAFEAESSATLPEGRRKPRVSKKDISIIGPWFSIPASVDLSDFTFQLSSTK